MSQILYPFSPLSIHSSLFIHLDVSGHLGYFHVLAIVNCAAMNIGVPESLSIMVSTGQGIFLIQLVFSLLFEGQAYIHCLSSSLRTTHIRK